MPEVDGLRWQQGHIELCTHPLLGERYIIDIDVTVKPLLRAARRRGGQLQSQEAGSSIARAPHLYAGGLRLILGVETAPGNEHTGAHAIGGLWKLIDGIPRDCWPSLLRCDSSIASEGDARGGDSEHQLSVQAPTNKERK
jgi:hypothetical protein